MLGSLFNKVAGLRSANFLKIDSNTGVSCGYCKTLENSSTHATRTVAASYHGTVKSAGVPVL